jgi:hypothetical protein
MDSRRLSAPIVYMHLGSKYQIRDGYCHPKMRWDGGMNVA